MNCSVLWKNVLGDVFSVNCRVHQGGVLSIFCSQYNMLMILLICHVTQDLAFTLANYFQAVFYMQMIFYCYLLAATVCSPC